MLDDKNLCLAIGCGAIGKSISGYVFSKMGFKVVFADAFLPAVEEMKPGKYSIFVSDKGTVTREDMEGFEAVMTDSPEFPELVKKAEVICTAVGPKGLESVLPALGNILKERKSDKALQLFLFENDVHACDRAREVLGDILGGLPSWLSIAGASIERMTQRYEYKEPAVFTEHFFPVFVNKKDTEDFTYPGYEKYFDKVEDFRHYYYRKLHTNNMGHGVLGFCGIPKGYKDTVEASKDPEIKDLLVKCLKESGQMLIRKYGFEQAKMDAYLGELVGRYSGMKDDLERLARDPIRKLGKDERIIGTIRKCLETGVPCENIRKMVKIAVDYCIFKEPEGTVAEIYKAEGIAGVLTKVSGLSEEDEAYKYILKA